MRAQLLTNALPGTNSASAPLPDDPSQQVLPLAQPEPAPSTGVPVRWEALQQTRIGDDWKLSGEVVLYYKNYVVRADSITYHQATSVIEAQGHLQLEGGPNDAVLTASHGEIHIQDHTASFYDVIGTFGVRRLGSARIYSTPDPFIFTGRLLLQTGEGSYRIVDGTMTSCRLPKPDWQIIAHAIEVANNKATTRNSRFEFFKIPLFYFPFLERSVNGPGRESGFLLPVFATSGVKGLVIGDHVYWAINRSMDMTLGLEYWSKRGYAPNGDFRYRGTGQDALTVRWNALIDRGIIETLAGATAPSLVNQGGSDILAFGRKDFSPATRLAGSAEYLSSFIYRLAFSENLALATSSEVQSDLALTHTHHAFVPSVSVDRFQSFAGSTNSSGAPVVTVPEVRVMHLPSARFDVVPSPLGQSPFYWSLNSSIADLARAEPHFHARNVGRLDIYPQIEWPLHLGDWQLRPRFALRTTLYSGSQTPDLAGTHFGGVPTVRHEPLDRSDVEASLEVRPPALERDFTGWNHQIRHVIEPQLSYRYVTGINNARQTLHFDTTDIATDTNEAGFSLTQRLFLKPLHEKPCPSDESAGQSASTCTPHPREWASWQIAQKFFINSDFGGALIENRRNVFDSTLDLTGVAYLTSPRNLSPILSRLRFEAIDRLRIEWDIDYDTKAGRLSSDNLFAGYSWGRTTVGIRNVLLNAPDEDGSKASLIQSHQIQPFLYFGKPSDVGFSVALNSSYDFTRGALQYGGVEAIYNWNCCGLNVGYRRFALGTLRNESEWLWGFTLSGLGTAGNIRRSTSVFPAQDALSHTY